MNILFGTFEILRKLELQKYKGIQMNFDDGQRPEIVYPCEWGYKVIGIDIEKILAAIEDAAEGLSYDVTPSNISRNGKYFSLNLKVVVPSEEKRDLIFQFLSSHSDIRFVL